MLKMKEAALRTYVTIQQRARDLIETKEEGVSEATTTILLVLLGIAAVAVLGGVVMAFLNAKAASIGD